MRVALRTDAGVYVYLAGQDGVSERTHSSASEFRVTGDIATQQNRFIRAENASTLDRGNLSQTLTFGTTRKFSTAAAAELWALDHDSDTTRTGTLVIDSLQSGGGVTRRYMAKAVVMPPEREVIGVTVSLRYTCVGGEILSNPPADLAIPF